MLAFRVAHRKLKSVTKPLPKLRPEWARVRVRLAGILQQRLWWWMVLGALSVLMLETAWVETRRETK